MDLSQLLAALPNFGAASEQMARGVPRAKALRTDLLVAMEQVAKLRSGVLSGYVFIARNLHEETRGTALAAMFTQVKADEALDVLLRVARDAPPRAASGRRRVPLSAARRGLRQP